MTALTPLTPGTLAAAVADVVRDPAPIATRLVCAPDVVYALQSIALPAEPPAPWQPSPLVRLTALPVTIDDELPAGVWRMLNAEGGVVREGTLEPTHRG